MTQEYSRKTLYLFLLSSIFATVALVACGDSSDNGSDNSNTNNTNTTQTSDPDAGSDASEEDTGVDIEEDAAPQPIPDGALKINEVAAAGTPSDWFEVINTSDATLDLSAVYFTDTIVDEPKRAVFPPGTQLEAGAFLVVYMDDSYPGFGLSSDEELALVAEDGRILDSVDWDKYQSPTGGSFGRFPDGTGAFKILQQPTPSASNVDNPDGGECGDGTPDEGEECDDGNLIDDDGCSGLCQEEIDPVCGNDLPEEGEECDDGNTIDGDGCSAGCTLEVAAQGSVVINEVVAFAAEGGADWVEFVNISDTTVDLSGWFFSDSDPTHIALFASGTTLAPGAFLVLERDDVEGGFDFGLGAEDEVLLYNASGTLVDRTGWSEEDATEGSSWGRSPSGTGEFSTQTPPSRNAENP